MICAVDNSEHPSLDALHKHIKSLKITQELYYTDYAPQRDLFSGEPIPFKAPADRYRQINFLNDINLKRYLKENSESRQWAVDWLIRRKADKGLLYPPLEVELRSLTAPTTAYFDSIGGYAKICKELGYTIRFDGKLSHTPLINCPIIIDTREQNPLEIKHPTIKSALNVGDYALPANHDKGTCIERKSLSDFVGTLSKREAYDGDSNLARFSRELERAKETGTYIIMLVECSIDEALGFNNVYSMRHFRVTPGHIFRNLRELFHKFDNFQALFVKGRVEAARAVLNLLEAGETVRQVDLQYCYQRGELTP